MGRPRSADRPVRECIHPKARHQHGTPQGYIADKCRCDPCTNANSDYADRRRRNIAYGRWGHDFTDAQPVREHVLELRAAGVSLRSVAASSGVSEGALNRLIYGEPAKGRQPSTRVLTRTAAAVLAVQPTFRNVLPAAFVDGTGTRRRLQALCAIGWTQNRLADELDVLMQTVNYYLHSETRVTAANAIRIADLYDRAWHAPPAPTNKWRAAGITRAKENARRHGWAPPLAWDDDTIDDPTATPHLEAEQRPGGKQLHVEDIEWLLDDEPLATAQRLADRLAVTKDAIQQACRHGQRTDLLDQLRRNAELANPDRVTKARKAA
jgi:transcriptional regulator with XRE-family HTH domain